MYQTCLRSLLKLRFLVFFPSSSDGYWQNSFPWTVELMDAMPSRPAKGISLKLHLLLKAYLTRSGPTRVIFLLLESESGVVQSCPTSCDPHGLGPTRLLQPWNSPGKNTGVDCHFLLQGNLPNPGIKPGYPTLEADALTSEPPGKSPKLSIIVYN